MKTDIEKQFIKEYQFGGIVHYCIETIRYSYNLEYIPPKNDNHNEFKKKYYNEILPSRIKQKMESFDESIITSYDSDLLNEISDNLLEYKTKQEKERYIHSLIVPFKELSDLLYPELAIKKRIDNELFENEKDRKYWSDINDFENVIINNKKLTPKQAKKLVKDNLQAIDNLAIEKKEQYDRLNMISKRFHEIIRKPNNEVEKTLSKFNKLKFMFANRLDALCLNNNIDFIKLQNEVEIYLKLRRKIEDIYIYIGTWEQTEKYINELQFHENEKQPIQQTKEKNLVQPPPKPLHFTKCFTTDEQENLFNGLIKAGLLEKEKYSHFCYVFGGTDIPDDEKPFKPLQWAGTLKELHYFITKCFPKEINQWKKAVNCFIKENESINKKSLSTAMDKYDKLPESSATIDKLCK